MSKTKLPAMGSAERRAAARARRVRLTYEKALIEPSRLREKEGDLDFDPAPNNPPSAVSVAATIALARLVDQEPQAIQDWRAGHTILLDIPDLTLFGELRASWRPVLDLPEGQVLYLDKVTYGERRDRYIAAALFVAEPPKNSEGTKRVFLDILGWGLPCLGISPDGKTCLPSVLVASARHHLVLVGIDAIVLARTITLVTGETCGLTGLEAVRFPLSAEHLALAVRHGRSPDACIAEIARLQRDCAADRSRSLSLDQLHGLAPAVAWARSTIADLKAWRRGEIGWDAIDHGVVLDGPPGTGKTLFAKVFAEEAGLPLITGSLAKWQGRGHLGDLLKGMRGDFAKARAHAPAVLFIDEIDAFGDRNSFRHEHADYSIQVVNGLIECLDGIDGRTGLIFIAASNAVRRCDPAIVRSGRLNRTLAIALPDEPARAAMLRVRLGADLPSADLASVAASTEGFSGADIEKLVKDARRIARQADRRLDFADLMSALDHEEAAVVPALRYRVAVHESGHALAMVLANERDDVRVSLRGRADALGSVTARIDGMAGTAEELQRYLVWALAGRAAEEALLGAPSAGAGGSPGSDLAQATQIAAAMVGAYGLAGPHPTLYVASAGNAASILAHPSLRQAVVDVLREAYDRALELMLTHRVALARIADELLEKRCLTGEDIARILSGIEDSQSVRSA